MNTLSAARTHLFVIFSLLFLATPTLAAPKSTAPERIKAVMIGDRVVDIAYNLGVLPEAMSVRASLWPMADKLKTVSQPIGCPKCITTARKNSVPDTLKNRGISQVIIEKNKEYCLFAPDVKPENVVPLLSNSGADIAYVDFSAGVESAIRQTAKLLDRAAQGEELASRYVKELDAVKAALPESARGKSVVVINGTYQADTGKSMLRVEAPNFYADRFLLTPLGCSNAGDAFREHGEISNGHYPVRKIKGQADLSPLLKADPDIIIMTGDALGVQQALHHEIAHNPEFLNLKAVRNLKIYSLPGYIDSSVIEYPQILRKWAVALSR